MEDGVGPELDRVGNMGDGAPEAAESWDCDRDEIGIVTLFKLTSD